MADPAANLSKGLHSELTINELRHVLLLRQTLSFNRAAELAGVSQSALSQSIARLEKRLGVVLFNRTRRAVSATPFAELIAERAESVLNALDDMDSRINALREAREGSLRFGMGLIPAELLLNEALSVFHRDHAHVDVRAIVDLPDELMDKMLASEIEFVAVADLARIHHADTVREHLFRYRHVILCRPGHPLTELASVRFRDFVRYPVVGYESDLLRTEMMQRLKTSEEFELIERSFPAVQLQQPWLMADLVSKSDFVIWAPEIGMSDWIDSGRLVSREISDLDGVFDVNLVWKEDISLSPVGQEMVAILRQLAGRICDKGRGFA